MEKKEIKTHLKSPHLPVHPYPKNAQVQRTPASLMGKMIPDVPWGPDAFGSSFTRKLFGRYVKSESYLLAFDMIPLGE